MFSSGSTTKKCFFRGAVSLSFASFYRVTPQEAAMVSSSGVVLDLSACGDLCRSAQLWLLNPVSIVIERGL